MSNEYMAELYPLKFNPIYKEKIWGGQKIRSVLGKDLQNLNNCGESWEISGVNGDISRVSQGQLKGENLTTLIDRYKGDLLGDSVYGRFGSEFPLLIKFIDANDDLSIQVHPDDELAVARHNSFGKTEMWYILQADPGSSLISGFSRTLDKISYLEYFNSGRLTEVLNREIVKKDDVFFLPAGRVHTIGKGLLLAEIQQTSDVTYRIYDFDRTDAKGNKRELHIEEALDALDFDHYDDYKTSYDPKINNTNPLVKCPYFQTNLLNYTVETTRNYSNIDSFVILIGLEGKLDIEYPEGSNTLVKGETILIPASINNLKLIPEVEFKILETSVPE